MTTAANDNVLKFTTGFYATRSICDHDCIFRFEVVGRTDKTVTIRSRDGRETRRKVRISNGMEAIDPMGRFSMSPVLSADDRVQ
ncbi:hypothetical protein [Bradyrhizobium sp. 153]|uniref:hypothetical protein n=1 Tax=Bradyrhizobium sp. 153 TaxID=2782627 RepID=UPI001FF77137|nr:hypothetical protein [Bradyrhizobium sp. 153]MCK1668607.1 hypothetical protein [Bradyrhizobium sp. 153]